MYVHGRDITIVPFASASFCEQIQSCLDQLNYRVKRQTPEQWLDLNYSPPCALLFDKSVDLDKHFEQIINKSKLSRTLGIFCCESQIWQPHLIEALDEYMGWPSHINELAFRVESLYHSKTAEHNARYNVHLDEFVEMNLIGQSAVFLKTLSLIKKTAQTDATVLIEGETGTGKELAARAIHYLGNRNNGPFIPVNCGAIPESLFESEFFGHKRGSFTDAKESQIGLVEQAEGGTLFLDEVDALPPKGQIALLRFLQDNKYRRIGGKKYRNANVRIISATNSPLNDLANKNDFRQDLLFRLNLMNIVMPPLRERSGDINILAQHFLDECKNKYQGPARYLSRHSKKTMNYYCWPGNVRELENRIHRSYLLTDEVEIVDLLDMEIDDRRQHPIDRRIAAFDCQSFSEAKTNVVQIFEKQYLQWLIIETNGNVTRAAEKAGKERRALGKLLKKHGIK